MDLFIAALEFIGVIAFASSGALEAIQSKMDILGVVIISVTTAFGGGIIRDLVLGVNPPNVFTDPNYMYVAMGVSLTIFMLLYFNKKILGNPSYKYFDILLTISDAIGLAVFTVLGMNVAFAVSQDFRGAIYIFVGLITGVGGGVLRDLMLSKVPYILDRNVYASASMLGAIIYYLLRRSTDLPIAVMMLISMLIIFTVRMIAAIKNIHLPKVD